jgi:hypothetical protein
MLVLGGGGRPGQHLLLPCRTLTAPMEPLAPAATPPIAEVNIHGDRDWDHSPLA